MASDETIRWIFIIHMDNINILTVSLHWYGFAYLWMIKRPLSINRVAVEDDDNAE